MDYQPIVGESATVAEDMGESLEDDLLMTLPTPCTVIFFEIDISDTDFRSANYRLIVKIRVSDILGRQLRFSEACAKTFVIRDSFSRLPDYQHLEKQ